VNEPEAKPTTVSPAATNGVQGACAKGCRGGRSRRVALLGLLGLVGGAAAGWLTTPPPSYRAEALVYIEAAMPSPDDPHGGNVLPMFEGFVAYQVQLLNSQRVAQLAMETEDWRGTGRETTPAAVARFLESRRIVHDPGTAHIQIQFAEATPELAVAGVRALLGAYEKVSVEENSNDDRLNFATTQRELLGAQRKEIANRLQVVAEPFGGVDGLQLRHSTSLHQLLAAEAELDKLRIENAVRARGGAAADPKSTEDADRESALVKRVELLREQNQRLSKVRTDVASLQRESEDTGTKLEQMKNVRDQLAAQLVGKGRISIRDRGSLPASPLPDTRPRGAALGGALGFLLGALAAVLLGARSRPTA